MIVMAQACWLLLHFSAEYACPANFEKRPSNGFDLAGHFVRQE